MDLYLQIKIMRSESKVSLKRSESKVSLNDKMILNKIFDFENFSIDDIDEKIFSNKIKKYELGINNKANFLIKMEIKNIKKAQVNIAYKDYKHLSLLGISPLKYSIKKLYDEISNFTFKDKLTLI